MMKTKKIKFQSTNVGVKFLHPQPASRLVPEWFRSLPGVSKGIETVKKCMPFLDSLTTGYMIVLSADVYYDKNGFQEITKDLQISTHDKTQIGTLPLTKEFDAQPYKWHNFFVSKTPKGYSTLFMHPANRVDLPFVSLTGIVETDKFPLAVNFPFLMKKDFSGVIPAGTPIIQAIPIKRENWETEVNDTRPWKQPSFVHTMHNPPFGFYKKHFWERKRYQ